MKASSAGVSKHELALFYRGRVKDVMTRRPATAGPDSDVQELASLMRDRSIGALVITDEGGAPCGIVTERDLVYKVVALGAGDARAADIMSAPLVTIEPEHHLYEALSLMLRHRCRRLVVTDSQGALVGMLSMRDLLRLEGYEARVIHRQIAQASSLEDLRSLHPDIHTFAQKLLLTEVDALVVTELLTEIHDAVTTRLIRLNEGRLREEREKPSGDFAWVSLGSEGRREQGLRGDQDNALIMSGEPTEDERGYYRTLAQRVNQELAEYGFPLCDGGVMAREDKYFGTLDQWRGRAFAVVRGIQDGDVLRDLTILLDLRHVCGDRRLTEQVWSSLLATLAQYPPAVRAMADDSVNKPVPLGFRGRLQYEKDDNGRHAINLKRYGLLPLVAGVKSLAVEAGLDLTNTGDRINALRERGLLDQESASNLLSALELFLRHKLQSSLDDAAGLGGGHFVYPQEWTEWEREDLKRAFRAVAQLEALLRFRFSL